MTKNDFYLKKLNEDDEIEITHSVGGSLITEIYTLKTAKVREKTPATLDYLYNQIKPEIPERIGVTKGRRTETEENLVEPIYLEDIISIQKI